MKKIVASWTVACALGCPCLALAQDKDTYQAEAGLVYYRTHSDTSRGNGAGLIGRYYFDALPTLPQDYPLEAGAFVERAASVSATYLRTSRDFDDFQMLKHGSSYGAEFVFRRPDMPLYVEGSYQYSDGGKFRSSTGSEFESDGKFYELAVGGYVGKTTLVTLEWAKGTAQSTNTWSSGTIERESSNVSIGIRGLHLAQLPGGSHVVFAAHAAQTKREAEGFPSEKNNSLSLAGTYYPTKMLGLNLGYEYDRGDARFAEGGTLGAGVGWFVTPTIRLSVDARRFQGKAPNSDADLIFLGALVRF